ncbi:MAG TPA: dTDP-4-dehydrorhamnose 3,5-epimerase, partial [Bacteroidales bacterium]|nr:dTDP-4-dehydrorhamnose 3,5-epimerase [Bacteroidales bacterium]
KRGSMNTLRMQDDAPISGVITGSTPEHRDERGTFAKLFSDGIPAFTDFTVRQANCVRTIEPDTLRGLHYQTGDYAEAKIFRVLEGKAQFGIIDLRPGGSSYLKSFTLILADPVNFLRVPRGCATGYCTLERNTTVLYFSDNRYQPDAEKGIRYNDPVLKIGWPRKPLIISPKDLSWPDFMNP